MADLLPLFPLPTVVLFPNVFLPLHVFEPRYREMVADALAGDHLIGMVLLRPGWEHDYDGRPPVYSVGCSGVITHFERLGDGRYNIILRGVERFRIVSEDHLRPYRRARVDSLPEAEPGPEDRALVRAQRAKLEALLTPALLPHPSESRPGRAAVGAVDLRGAAAMPDADLVNALAQYLDLEPLEKQALLEQSCLRSRVQALVELLEMKLMMARTPGLSNTAH